MRFSCSSLKSILNYRMIQKQRCKSVFQSNVSYLEAAINFLHSLTLSGHFSFLSYFEESYVDEHFYYSLLVAFDLYTLFDHLYGKLA